MKLGSKIGMRFSKAYIFPLVFSVLLGSCNSLQKTANVDYLNAIKDLPVGADFQKVKELFGDPSLVERETSSGSKLIYFIDYHGSKIPKVIVWLNESDKVTMKHINLFSESGDDMTEADAKKIFGDLNLKAEKSSKRRTHFISSTKILEDSKKGVSLQINEARNSEVQSISWALPFSNSKDRHSASE